MGNFVQIHLLTSYPPSNLNRDDLGRPKSAMLGTAPRLRVSSQSLKRAWRTSEVFREALAGHIGTRTKSLARRHVFEPLREALGVDQALSIAEQIAGVFGKNQSARKPAKDATPEQVIEARLAAADTEQLAHLAPEEIGNVDTLVRLLASEKRAPTKAELELLRHKPSAVDIALFGRMLAASPEFNVEAASQVAHAITVHRAVAQEDYFTAVDDLKGSDEDRGAGHVGEAEFGAGVYYLYVCVDRDLLVENLRGDEALASHAIEALVRAAATVAPRGKQASFASRSRASYVRVEKGQDQPRSLAMAFVEPVSGDDVIGNAVKKLRKQADAFATVYDDGPRLEVYEVDALKGEGRFSKLVAFAASPVEA